MAVEAASGVSLREGQSSAHNSLHSGPTITLSNGMKNMKRRQAVAKLSQAYHVDEIATSVVTMQGSTPMDDLASQVLQREVGDLNASYVNFFHEKIPSREVDQYTDLAPLTSIIHHQPADASMYRTRALTRIFKHDLVGAAKDLSDALSIARKTRNTHRPERVIPKAYLNSTGSLRMGECASQRMADEEHPSSIEPHLLFHRAGVYLKIACESIETTLAAWSLQHELVERLGLNEETGLHITQEDVDKMKQGHLDRRKAVKSNARKALRDYVEYMSYLDYTPGISAAESASITEELSTYDMIKLEETSSILSIGSNSSDDSNRPELVLPKVFKLNTLFAETALPNIPEFPSTSQELIRKLPEGNGENRQHMQQKQYQAEFEVYQKERVTFHPFLTEALHSFLLCHALVQTSTTELKRHATNAARIERLLSGWPLFNAARSTARADWDEVLKQTKDWIGIGQSWNDFARSSKHAPSHDNAHRELDRQSGQHGDHQADLLPGEATDRADIIARWILEAPQTVEGAKSRRKRRPAKTNTQAIPMRSKSSCLSEISASAGPSTA